MSTKLSIRLRPAATCAATALSLFAALAPCTSRAADPNEILADKAIAWSWRVDNQKLHPLALEDKLNDKSLPLMGECFQIVLGDGTVLKSSDLQLDGTPKVESLERDFSSPSLARHFPGKELVAQFSAPDKHLTAEWRVSL